MNFEEEINKLKERNRRVEADKAWETSFFRIGLISIITYLVTAWVFYLIGVNDYLLNPLIPTTGYFLSTQTIPFVKKWWLKKYGK